jgi:hypothetical protein
MKFTQDPYGSDSFFEELFDDRLIVSLMVANELKTMFVFLSRVSHEQPSCYLNVLTRASIPFSTNRTSQIHSFMIRRIRISMIRSQYLRGSQIGLFAS